MIVKQIHETEVMFLGSNAIHHDPRGSFLEMRRDSETLKMFNQRFVQTNLSKSAPFVIRGLHYQLGPSQGKLMRCVHGKIFQVSVDVRKNSPFFGRWWAHVLDGESGDCVWVPPGHANGFYTFEIGAIVLYEMTAEFDPALDCGLFWNDPDVKIDWPFGVGANLTISEKDRNAKRLNEITPWEKPDAKSDR